jgi:hypothetical protein
MSEHAASAPRPAPGPLCAAYAPLLPLLDAGALPPEQEASLREHQAGCAWCRNERAAYVAVDAALRRRYATLPAARPLTMEDIMQRDITRGDAFDTQPATTGRTSRLTNRHELRTSHLPDQPGRPDSPRGSMPGSTRGGGGDRRGGGAPWAALGAVAAALLLVVLAASLFASMRPSTQATPGGAATSPAAPTCNDNFTRSPIKGAQTAVEGVPLPPQTYVVPDDATNLRGYDLCSAGTAASVSTYLTGALPSAGWTHVASDPRCFYQDQCWTKGSAAAISWHVDDPTDWHIAYHPMTA